ncbi:MAG TPA: hypothetical protein VGL22_10250 [Terracidiphilus sp.]|jgi:hypothetical protein
MKALASVAMAGVCVAAAAQNVTERAHAETSFDLRVKAPYAETAKLFGPEGERAWAGKHWDPQFVYPAEPRDEQGAVFTIQHGPLTAVWVIAQHDVEARHFQYVYILGDLMVCTIDVRFAEAGANATTVHVTYARTAVRAEGDAHVATMAEGDRRAGAEWQAAIDSHLSDHKNR